MRRAGPAPPYPARSQQIFERLTLLGTVTVAIEFDVSIDVIDEMTQAIIVVPSAVGPVEQPPEHFWDNVFTAKALCRGFLYRSTVHGSVRRSYLGR